MISSDTGVGRHTSEDTLIGPEMDRMPDHEEVKEAVVVHSIAA